MMAATDFFKTKFPIIALMMGFVPFYIEVYRQVSGVLRQTALLIISLVSTPYYISQDTSLILVRCRSIVFFRLPFPESGVHVRV